MLKVLLVYLICTQKCNAQFFADVGHFFTHTVYHLIIPISRYTTPRPDVKVVYFELEQLQPHVVESFLDGCHDGAVYTTFRENSLFNVGERTCYWCVCVYRDYAKCWARTTERCRSMRKYYSHVMPDEHTHYANRLRIRRSKSGQIIKYSQDIPQTIHIREAPSPASPNCTNTSKPYDVKKGHGEKCSHHLSCECVKDTWSCSTLKLCYEDAPEESDLEPVKRLDEVINSLKGNNFYLNGTFEDINQYVLEHVDNWFNFNKSNSIVAEVLKDTDANPFDK